MSLSLAPWYYRNLLLDNNIIESPEYFETDLLDGKHHFEASVSLKSHLRPSWLSKSELYKNTDGSGSGVHKNVAVYKAISEALERWAFYETVDNEHEKYKYDYNPTTTGLAAFPHFKAHGARVNARCEAIERWAIHEFNRCNLPVKEHNSSISGLRHYEIVTPFSEVCVTLIEYWTGDYYCYGFAAGLSMNQSLTKALVELQRNYQVLKKTLNRNVEIESFQATVDKTLFYFSTIEGNYTFNDIKSRASKTIVNENPVLLCDMEVHGPWSKYSKVWRYLLEDSYFDCRNDVKFFMF